MPVYMFAQAATHLSGSKLPSSVMGMDAKAWFSETSHQRITDDVVAGILGVTRKTANKRLNEGLDTDDIINIARALRINTVTALVELDRIEYQEVLDYLDGGGQLIENADDGALALELAKRLNPISRLADVRSIEDARRSTLTDSDVEAALLDANDGRAVAQGRTDELPEPETP